MDKEIGKVVDVYIRQIDDLRDYYKNNEINTDRYIRAHRDISENTAIVLRELRETSLETLKEKSSDALVEKSVHSLQREGKE